MLSPPEVLGCRRRIATARRLVRRAVKKRMGLELLLFFFFFFFLRLGHKLYGSNKIRSNWFGLFLLICHIGFDGAFSIDTGLEPVVVARPICWVGSLYNL